VEKGEMTGWRMKGRPFASVGPVAVVVGWALSGTQRGRCDESEIEDVSEWVVVGSLAKSRPIEERGGLGVLWFGGRGSGLWVRRVVERGPLAW
jgi:hypothetical protein